MINAVVDGITNALYEEFGEHYEIHTEASMQDMKEPAFFVRCINPSMQGQLGSRRKADLLFIVQYFPESAEPCREINSVYERICDCLELIEVDGKMTRGVVECKDITDGILTATAEYTLFLNRRNPDETMEDYEMKGVVNHAGGKDNGN